MQDESYELETVPEAPPEPQTDESLDATTTAILKLNAAVEVLADARQDVLQQTRTYDEVQTRVDLALKAAGLTVALETAQSNLAAVETWEKSCYEAARRAAVTVHTLSDNKRPHPAVQIKDYVMVGWDPGPTEKWCLKYMPLALTINEKALTALVLALAEARPGEIPMCMAVITEHKPTIKRDLSEYVTPDPADG